MGYRIEKLELFSTISKMGGGGAQQTTTLTNLILKQPTTPEYRQNYRNIIL